MNRRGIYNFTAAAGVSGGIITMMLLAVGAPITFIAPWILVNLVVLGYIIHTGGPE